MFKKILSAALVLAMALSVVGALQMTSFAADTFAYGDYADYLMHLWKRADGNAISLDFRDTYGGYTTWTGFKGKIPADSRPYCGGAKSGSSAPNGAPGIGQGASFDGNYGIRAGIANGKSFATNAELSALQSTAYFVNVNGAATPALYLKFDPANYKTAVNGGLTCGANEIIHYLIIADASGRKFWYPITPSAEQLDAEGNLVAGTYDYDASKIPGGWATNGFFTAYWDGAPYMYQSGTGIATGLRDITSGSSISFEPAFGAASTGFESLDAEGNPKGYLVYQLPYGYTAEAINGSAPGVGPTLMYNGIRIAELQPQCVSFTTNASAPHYTKSGAAKNGRYYVASGWDINGVLNSDDALTPIKEFFAYEANVMRTLVVVVDYNNDTIKYFYGGYPVYFGATDGKYYDELVFETDAEDMQVAGSNGIYFSINRGDVAVGWDCYFDNIGSKWMSQLAEVDAEVVKMTALTSKGPNWTEDLNAYQGIALKANLKGNLNKMKWVFNTEDEIYYSDTITFETPIAVDGDITFGAVIKNGTAIEGNLGDGANIVDVDAIFDVGGNTVFTNYFYKKKAQ